MNNKLALVLGFLEGIIIVALIVFIIILLNGNKNSDSIKTTDNNTTNNVVNKNATDTDANDLVNSAQVKKILNMSDAEFVEYAKNFADYEYKGFSIEEKEKRYNNGCGSASSVSEAIELVEDNAYRYPNILKIDETTPDDIINAKLVDETDYYYAIDLQYTAKGTTGDVTVEDTYVVFKDDMFESVMEYNNYLRKINLNSANTKEKIKRVMDLYTFLDIKANLFEPTLVEKDDCYEYTYCFVVYRGTGDSIFTDTALVIKNEAVLGTYTIKIDKKDGKFEPNTGEEKILRTVEGKNSEIKLPNQSED